MERNATAVSVKVREYKVQDLFALDQHQTHHAHALTLLMAHSAVTALTANSGTSLSIIRLMLILLVSALTLLIQASCHAAAALLRANFNLQLHAQLTKLNQLANA